MILLTGGAGYIGSHTLLELFKTDREVVLLDNFSNSDKSVIQKLEKAFEQSAGFLRIRQGEHPLDNTAVHPESYPIVEKMAKDLKLTVHDLIANKEKIAQIQPENYITSEIGILTLKDALKAEYAAINSSATLGSSRLVEMTNKCPSHALLDVAWYSARSSALQ